MNDKEFISALKDMDNDTLIDNLEDLGGDAYYQELRSAIIAEIRKRLTDREKESDLDHYTRVKEWAKNNGFVLVTEEWYDKARAAYYWRYYGER